MQREYCYPLVLLTTFIASNIASDAEKLRIQLFDTRLSIEDDPDIKWVQFAVDVNNEFLEFEEPQFNCTVIIPKQTNWTAEFQKQLLDQDIVYTWMEVQNNDLTNRARKKQLSVAASPRGDRSGILTTASKPLDSVRTVAASVPKPVCESTITVVQNSNAKICRNQIIFEDDFKLFNNEYWTNEIRIPTTRLDSEFVIYNGNVIVDNDILKITANFSEHGINWPLNLGQSCTSKNINECVFEARRRKFLPPIKSGRINSAKYFNFKYGRIEVKAKVPKGDWLFPLISLEPSAEEYGSSPFANGEMRVAFVRGNQNITLNNVNIGGTRLFGGAIFSLAADSRHQFMANTTLAEANGVNEHFGDKFHVYSLTWTPAELLLSVDGKEYGKILTDFKNSLNIPSWRNGAANVPLDQMFYITLGLSAGGHGDFPESIRKKPWENTHPKAIRDFYYKRDDWLESWTQPSLEIDYVRVYAV